MLSFLLSACGPGTIDLPATSRPAPPEPRPVTAVSLDLGDVDATFDIAPSSRPEGTDAIELVGPFVRASGQSDRTQTWSVPLPVVADLMPTKTKGTHTFGSAPPPGLSVHGPKGELAFDRRGKRSGTYHFDRDHLFVVTGAGEPPPKAADHRVTFARATKAERELNLAQSGMSVDEFVHRDVTVDGTSHRGLLLPAPSTATFRLRVPEAGVLSFRHFVVNPAITAATRSDGASIGVTVRADGEESKVATFEVRLGDPVHARVDLSAWAGRDVELVLATDPGESPALDYVFLEDPVVYTPSSHPRRAMLIFVDTTRPDHLGFMGYERETTPVLDRWSAHAAVFEDARSVAPWTLPSARAVLTGDEPERWYATEKLAESFAKAGWRTEAVVSNAFLSQPFDVQVGWGRFRFEHLLAPPQIVAAGRDALEEEPDRDTLLMVHFMGPHLPWEEPLTQRWRWAGTRPESLKADGRVSIMQVQQYDPAFDDIREYVVARYDQNIRWTDGELQSLLEAGGPDATVVFFSDHGEELWDHRGFEHGHSLYDELLRVPLAIKSPSLQEGRYAAPVSLMDIAPTLREIEGLPPLDDGAHGRSLVAYTFGEAGAAGALEDRKLAFGRPLYGDDGWGVIDAGKKWTSRAGVQTVYDLAADPGEEHDLAGELDLSTWPDALSAALGRPVRRVWRVRISADVVPSELTLTVSHPDGLARAWSAYDPRGRAGGLQPEVKNGRVALTIPPNADAPLAIYVEPAGDPLLPDGLAATLVGRGVMVGGTVDGGPVTPANRSAPFLQVGDTRSSLLLDLVVVPEPDGVEVAGYHPDLRQQLEELGYLGE